MSIFIVGGRRFNFSSDYAFYGEIRRQLELEVNKASIEFDKKYAGWGDIENVIANIDTWFQETTDKAFESCKGIAISHGIYDYNLDRLKELSASKTIFMFQPYYDAKYTFSKKLEEINNTQESEEQRRALRKETRTRIVGGGFGVSGAVKGMAIAGAVNLGTGLAHGAFNMFGNMMTSISASSDRRELYSLARPYLFDGVKQSILNLMPFIAKCIGVSINLDQNKEKSILKNINNGSLEGCNLQRPFLDALTAYPYDDALYKYYLLEYPHEQENVLEMANFCGIDLKAFVSEKCKMHGFVFDSLEEAVYCRNSEVEFLTKIEKLTETRFALSILDEEFWDNAIGNLVLPSLIDRFKEKKAPNSSTSIDLYYKYMIEKIEGVCEKKGIQKTVKLPYAMGRANKDLALKLGVFQNYFLSIDSICPYMSFCENGNYFEYNNEVDKIVIGPEGITVNDSDDINPISIKTIDYEKDFIGSTIIINDNKYKVTSIGNDMKYIVNLIKDILFELSSCYTLCLADKHNVPAAMYVVGSIYEDDKTNIDNMKTAFKYYAKAALNGEGRAQEKIGQCYSCGEIIPVNLEVAKYWYEKALEGGMENIRPILSDKKWNDINAASEEISREITANDFSCREALTQQLQNVEKNQNVLEESIEDKESIPIAKDDKVEKQESVETATKNNTIDAGAYVVSFGALIIVMFLQNMAVGSWFNYIMAPVLLLTCVMWLAVIYLRIKSVGKSGWLFIINFIPIINILFWIYLAFAKTVPIEKEENKKDIM